MNPAKKIAARAKVGKITAALRSIKNGTRLLIQSRNEHNTTTEQMMDSANISRERVGAMLAWGDAFYPNSGPTFDRLIESTMRPEWTAEQKDAIRKGATDLIYNTTRQAWSERMDYKNYDLIVTDIGSGAELSSIKMGLALDATERGRRAMDVALHGSKTWAMVRESWSPGPGEMAANGYFYVPCPFGEAIAEKGFIDEFKLHSATYDVAVLAAMADPGLRIAVGSSENGFVASVAVTDMRRDKTSRASACMDDAILDGSVLRISVFDQEKINEMELRDGLQAEGLNLFDLSDKVVDAVYEMGPEGRTSTLTAMRDMGLLSLPHDMIAIRVRVPDTKDFVTVKITGPLIVKDNDAVGAAVIGTIMPPVFVERPHEPLALIDGPAVHGDLTYGQVSTLALTVLLIALATRNIVKRNRFVGEKTKSVRGLKVGPCGVTYISRTVIEMPDVSSMPTDGTAGQGQAIPHLRRGHAHTVRFGKQWAERRVDWFPPIFVNGDPSFAPKPKTYKVTS